MEKLQFFKKKFQRIMAVVLAFALLTGSVTFASANEGSGEEPKTQQGAGNDLISEDDGEEEAGEEKTGGDKEGEEENGEDDNNDDDKVDDKVDAKDGDGTVEEENNEEKAVFEFDLQPETMEEVQTLIDAYETSELRYLAQKPRWEFEVDESLMPSGYQCDYLVDEELGVTYWTFFPKVMAIDGGGAVDETGLPIPDGEYFRFQVTVGDGDKSFYLPTSGYVKHSNGSTFYSYDWNIDWGDGTSMQRKSGTADYQSYGIFHNYPQGGTYTITITPANSDQAWFGAFGFYDINSMSNSDNNKGKVTKLISPITPLMTRTDAQITATSDLPVDEWIYAFYKCKNLTMGDEFTFDQVKWANVTTVGNGFASRMFEGCSGENFTMGKSFNLPQGIETVGSRFAYAMFKDNNGKNFNMNADFNLPEKIETIGEAFAYEMFFNCSHENFTMNENFNLPEGITKANNYFAARMFAYCSGPAFTMGKYFNLPVNITEVGIDFAKEMFTFCNGGGFKMSTDFNLPQGIEVVDKNFAFSMFREAGSIYFQINTEFKFPKLNDGEIEKDKIFSETLNLHNSTPIQFRTAKSIIGDIEPPDEIMHTFYDNSSYSQDAKFTDIYEIDKNWGGAVSYEVTFNPGRAGNSIPIGTMRSGIGGFALPYKIPANEFVIPGYLFAGWKRSGGVYSYKIDHDNSETIPTKIITGPITLTAQWEKVPDNYYTIIYNSNYGAGVIESEWEVEEKTDDPHRILYHDDPNLEFDLAGHEFLGWSTNPDSTSAEYEANEIIPGGYDGEIIYLYALWEPQYAEIDVFVMINKELADTFKLSLLKAETEYDEIIDKAKELISEKYNPQDFETEIILGGNEIAQGTAVSAEDMENIAVNAWHIATQTYVLLGRTITFTDGELIDENTILAKLIELGVQIKINDGEYTNYKELEDKYAITILPADDMLGFTYMTVGSNPVAVVVSELGGEIVYTSGSEPVVVNPQAPVISVVNNSVRYAVNSNVQPIDFLRDIGASVADKYPNEGLQTRNIFGYENIDFTVSSASAYIVTLEYTNTHKVEAKPVSVEVYIYSEDTAPGGGTAEDGTDDEEDETDLFQGGENIPLGGSNPNNAGLSAVRSSADENTYLILDENGTPLGTVELENGQDIDSVNILDNLTPLGGGDLSVIKHNPQTGLNSGKAMKIILVMACFAGFTALTLRRRKNGYIS